ncbi:hypothetical protein [Corallococcus macrosporus]|uniref:Uncharacterized protein n=1 Tax=Myxococcus fulvus (strain ATCC BAA-855 / HW-1) TaxID=483219 RepID=F8CLP0_MYXFH|nr:hypothetical protein [Corallococcus macrosporus]AEI67749.1 hypothetical protein LILAB_29340 [Corallococcus macrosporus]
MLLRVLVWAVSGVVLVAVAAMVAIQVVAQREYGPVLEQYQADATAHVETYCREHARLAEEPWFHEPRPHGDAGPLLNAWLGSDDARPLPAGSPLHVPAHLPQQNHGWEDWVTEEVDLSGLDFAWMRQLHGFDHWNPIHGTAASPDARFDLVAASVQNVSLLQLWSKFRLRHALQTGAYAEAAQDVRQLAWLAYRTDTLIGGMVGIALLRLEARAHASLENPPAAWRPMSEAQLERFFAIVWASTAYSSVATPMEVSQRAHACGTAIGRCIGLTEAAFGARLLEPFAKRSYPEAYAALEAKSSEAACATPVLRTILERGVTLLDFEDAALFMDLTPPPLMKALPERLWLAHVANLELAAGLSERLARLKALGAPSASPPPAEAP